MALKEEVLAQFLGDETFPIAWTSETEKLLFWVYDDLHCPKPIRAPYLVGAADFVAVHHFPFVERLDVLATAAPGATLLLNVRWSGPLDVRPHLGALRDLGATDEDVLGVLAGLAGYLVEAAAQPPAPGLPTLRAFQREQGRAALALLQELWPAG